MKRHYPTSDPTEADLRERWHAAKDAFVGNSTPSTTAAFHQADEQLASYLWNRVQAEVQADRLRHPRARRNQPKPFGIEPSGNRALP